MAVSVVRKLERCERLGRASRLQGDATSMLHYGENYQVIMKYKIKIKDYVTTTHTKLDHPSVMTGSLNQEIPLPALRLQNLQLHAQGASNGSCSPSPPCVKLHGESCMGTVPARSSSPPCNLQDQIPPLAPLHNLHDQDEDMLLHSLQPYEELESLWLQHPWKLPENVLHQHVHSNTSSQAMLRQPLTLQPSAVNEQESLAAFPAWKLEKSSDERAKVIIWASPNLQQTAKEREEEASAPSKVHQKATEEEMDQLGSGEGGRGGARPPSKLKKEAQDQKAGGGGWEAGVKKMECECCGMEEECTGGYEEKVRAGLRGHWLCGLCEEAVGEEKKRVGGSVQAALAAHMQPCRRFSRRARSKACPPPSDVAVPHAVCRLLCRHLSTPFPRHPPSSSHSLSLSRCSSCLPSLPN